MLNPVDRAEELIRSAGRVHLVGVGGIGMAGVTLLLKKRGVQVSGCDLQENRQTEWLDREGVEIHTGHDAVHVDERTDWLVRSTAVPDSHLEVMRARELGIPVSRRGEVLPALMRNRYCIAVSGTHGKTTTTAFIAQVLGCGYCIGGEVVGFEGVARDGEIMVVEADESDGTVAGYTPDIAVITNIEYDHMEHHDSESAFIDCFKTFIENTKEKVYYCGDDPISKQVVQISLSALEQAGKHAPHKCEPYFLPASGIKLPIPGKHNQWNAAAALKVSRHWKNETEIFQALEKVKPIKRRFEKVYEGGGVTIISDYAHHPTEIAALIRTALELKPKRLLGIFQPHRYTRTLALGEDFPPAFHGLEKLWLVPVYPASEQPIEGGTSQDLLERFVRDPVAAKHCEGGWNNRIKNFQSLETAWADIQAELAPGDLLLIIGAGDIEQVADWANDRV